MHTLTGVIGVNDSSQIVIRCYVEYFESFICRQHPSAELAILPETSCAYQEVVDAETKPSSLMEKTEFLLQTIQQLREEIISTQKIRAQIIGFKLTYVTAGVGYIFSEKLLPPLLILVAFGAILFDFLITGQSVSIKRAGYYMRTRTGPMLRESQDWPEKFQFWEEFMAERPEKGGYATLGNLGQTFLVFILALFSPLIPYPYEWNALNITGLAVVLFILCFFMRQNIRFYRTPSKYNTQHTPDFHTTFAGDLKWLWRTLQDNHAPAAKSKVKSGPST